MIKHFHKLATYTAIVIISAMPFSNDALADPEKKSKSIVSAHAKHPISDTTANANKQ